MLHVTCHHQWEPWFLLCIRDSGPGIMLALGHVEYMGDVHVYAHSDFGCLEVKSAAGPSCIPVSLGMHMCSSLLVVLLCTVLMLNSIIVLIYMCFSAFWAIFRPLVSRSWIRSWNAYPPCGCQMSEGPWSTSTPFTSPTVTSMACTISNR